MIRRLLKRAIGSKEPANALRFDQPGDTHDSDAVQTLDATLHQVSRIDKAVQKYFSAVHVAQQRFITSIRRNGRPFGIEKNPGRSGVHLILDAIFLFRSYRLLLEAVLPGAGGFRESIHFGTGVRVADRTYVVSHIVPVAFATQTHSGVEVAPESNVATFKALYELEAAVLLHIHSHPGRGPGATVPSPTDLRYQETLHRGGFHIAPACIISEDGFCRFWSKPGHEFSIDIRGPIEEIEPNVYRIPLADQGISFE